MIDTEQDVFRPAKNETIELDAGTARGQTVNFLALAAGSTALSVASSFFFKGRTFRNIFGLVATGLAIAGLYDQYSRAVSRIDPQSLH